MQRKALVQRTVLRITRDLSRAVDPELVSIAEGQLVLAVLRQAIDDLFLIGLDPNPENKIDNAWDAAQFIVSPAWEAVCSSLKLDPDLGRDLVRKHALAMARKLAKPIRCYTEIPILLSSSTTEVS